MLFLDRALLDHPDVMDQLRHPVLVFHQTGTAAFNPAHIQHIV